MIDIVNLDKDFEVDEKLLVSTAHKVLKEEGINKNIEVAFVKEEEIQALNKKYRNIDKATDVLSFGTINDPLPQIVICLSEVKKNGEDFEKELSKVLIHGILHLMGMDHIEKKDAEEMFKKQDKYLVK
ncbi:MAG: rRNA maturation RNase YbeY [Candidatus Pacebacteria bacterium]|jgi:probable rRNA maturation factor|nr:rRNA maturation RNase YbeY [Candidatus Paceibacterota bacterium]MDD5013058.1 rRNA maturation RNase YbeY [Candidatus Paceibacterota bacterium]MDD5752940.1 rRNA maturation RNase YbeY [Candidatus Paceibacterota bacterium]